MWGLQALVQPRLFPASKAQLGETVDPSSSEGKAWPFLTVTPTLAHLPPLWGPRPEGLVSWPLSLRFLETHRQCGVLR